MTSVPMSLNYSEPPIELKPRPSSILAWVLGLFHILVIGVILFGVDPKAAAAVLILLALLSWYRSHRLHIRHLGRGAVRRLQWQADGSWLLDDAYGYSHAARLLPSSYLHPRLVLLNFRLEENGRRRYVLLLPDSLDSESLRRLRVRLRIEATVGQKAGFNRA